MLDFVTLLLPNVCTGTWQYIVQLFDSSGQDETLESSKDSYGLEVVFDCQWN